jgi:hypothetical protein
MFFKYECLLFDIYFNYLSNLIALAIFLLNKFFFFSSPWSNKYDPPLSDGAVPSAKLRQLELQANDAFDVYRDL